MTQLVSGQSDLLCPWRNCGQSSGGSGIIQMGDDCNDQGNTFLPTDPGGYITDGGTDPLQVTFADWTVGDILTIQWYASLLADGETASVGGSVVPKVDIGLGYQSLTTGDSKTYSEGPISTPTSVLSGIVSIALSAAPSIRLYGIQASLAESAAVSRVYMLCTRSAAGIWLPGSPKGALVAP